MLKTQGTLFIDGDEPWRCTEGVVDASALPNRFRANKGYNKLYGSTGDADNGSETLLPGKDSWEFWCNYMYNCREDGIVAVEEGGHDWQAAEIFLETPKETLLAEIRHMLNAAAIYSVRVLLIMGGLSDKSTAEQGFVILDKTSETYKKHNELVAYLADELYGHPALIGISQLNELDFVTVSEKFWKKYFPDPDERIKAIGAYQQNKYDAVKALQKRPGVLLTFGTAVDSDIYPWAWKSEAEKPNKLLYAFLGCDFCNPHFYLNEDYQNHRDVLYNEKFPALAATARALRMPVLIGETGKHWLGGIRAKEIEDQLLKYDEFSWLWMVRWFNPKQFETLPVFPVEVYYDPDVLWSIDHSVPIPPEPDDQEKSLQEIEGILSNMRTHVMTAAMALNDLGNDLEAWKVWLRK